MLVRELEKKFSGKGCMVFSCIYGDYLILEGECWKWRLNSILFESLFSLFFLKRNCDCFACFCFKRLWADWFLLVFGKENSLQRLLTQRRCCDRCEQWRLLPNGRTPDEFPEAWVCSMMDWLPGMNNCNFIEGETTEALRALYQPPLPANPHIGQYNAGRVVTNVTSVDTHYNNLGIQMFLVDAYVAIDMCVGSLIVYVWHHM